VEDIVLKKIIGKKCGLTAFLAVSLLTQGGCATQNRLSAENTANPSAQIAEERLLPLQGGQNFRDLGGYVGAGGQTVRWGVLFRSGSMNKLTPADFAYLSEHKLRTVIDLRSTEERAKAPVRWPDSNSPNVLSKDYKLDTDGIKQMLSTPDMNAEKARATMAALYREVPFQFAAQYREMFAQLLAGHVPLAFNCSAGKDRTGVAAALLLTALGVPRETVIQDYMLSNQYVQPEKAAERSGDAFAPLLGSLPPEAIETMARVDRSYIEAAFAAIEARPGGLDGYFRDELGLSKGEIAILQAKLLVAK